MQTTTHQIYTAAPQKYKIPLRLPTHQWVCVFPGKGLNKYWVESTLMALLSSLSKLFQWFQWFGSRMHSNTLHCSLCKWVYRVLSRIHSNTHLGSLCKWWSRWKAGRSYMQKACYLLSAAAWPGFRLGAGRLYTPRNRRPSMLRA